MKDLSSVRAKGVTATPQEKKPIGPSIFQKHCRNIRWFRGAQRINLFAVCVLSLCQKSSHPDCAIKKASNFADFAFQDVAQSAVRIKKLQQPYLQSTISIENAFWKESSVFLEH